MSRRLAEDSNQPELENRLERSIRFARNIDQVYWIGIGATEIPGVTEPF